MLPLVKLHHLPDLVWQHHQSYAEIQHQIFVVVVHQRLEVLTDLVEVVELVVVPRLALTHQVFFMFILFWVFFWHTRVLLVHKGLLQLHGEKHENAVLDDWKVLSPAALFVNHASNPMAQFECWSANHSPICLNFCEQFLIEEPHVHQHRQCHDQPGPSSTNSLCAIDTGTFAATYPKHKLLLQRHKLVHDKDAHALPWMLSHRCLKSHGTCWATIEHGPSPNHEEHDLRECLASRKAIKQLPWARTIWFVLSAKLVLDFENILPGCAVMGNLIVWGILTPRTNLVHCHSWLQWYRCMRGWIKIAPRLHESHHHCDCVLVQLQHTLFKHQTSKAHPCSSAWQEGRLAQSEKICSFFSADALCLQNPRLFACMQNAHQLLNGKWVT